MNTQLDEKSRRRLRTLAHDLKPFVRVGIAGLTENVLIEVDAALKAHELIKVKVTAGDRETRDSMVHSILTKTGAILVQRVGHVATLYRRNNDKPKIDLPS